MKTIKLLLALVITPILLSSCSINYDDGYVGGNETLPQLMNRYELWYVDYNRTTGNGEIPFLSRAFTISFVDGTLFANNNLVGIGSTGNGYGINVGYYDFYPETIRFFHSVYGQYNLEVHRLSANEIRLYDRNQNTSYYLVGYQRNGFDYNRLFYDNITYFLQEYKAWEKVYTSQYGALNDFDHENFLQFLSSGNNFRSSQSTPGTPVNNIYWDFTGLYGIHNIYGNPNAKNLTLDYDFWGNEAFRLTVINDSRIRLFHQASGTTYEFQGRGFIQYLKEGGLKRVKQEELKLS
ncbi:nicotinic acid mononucleotide adenyltransferase [Flavobacterium supellecticarium]|uniref:Nicotinic acid mononucleotide adenyltransferase n=1 Tax=Flavobacterium supellecticarium TaxID=2565924 RepID=A0A4S3ZRD8_9FLAO|nr:nicotinic acid mononucleotide adenyltransferase [Flavobacterium supellecticarium]THF48153.1 nicotinic acid mononucleotide adenyltransferase [Flavobacterium supellecticarium]